MNYRELGRSGVRVSEIGLGLWPAGGSVFLADVPTGYGKVPESEVLRGIRRALDFGVSFFDTADSYGLGRSERLLGKAVADRRGQVVVATKAGWVPDGEERWMRDLSGDHLRASARRSLRRLGLDAIDLFQLHAVPEEGAETDEALDALDDLKTTGVIRLAGVSVGSSWEGGLRLLGTGRLDAIQVSYNLLQQGAAEELLDEAEARQVGVIGSIPLAHGFLSGRHTAGATFADDDWRSRLSREEIAASANRVQDLRFLTSTGERSMLDAALRFALSHRAVSTTIPGFRNEDQVEELVAASDSPPFTDIELARARELGRAWARSTPVET